MTLLPFLIVIGGFLCYESWTKFRKWIAVTLVAAVVVLSGYVVWLNGRIDEHWGVSRAATYYAYLTATDTPLQAVLADPLHNYMISRGPECLGGIRASAGGITGPDPWQLRRVMASECPEGVAWLETHFQTEYVKFLAISPQYLGRFVLHYLPEAGNAGGYARVTSVLPASVAQVFESANVDEHYFSPLYLWILGGWAMLCAAMWMRLRARKFGMNLELPVAALVSATIALTGTVVTLNSEVSRIASQASGVLILSTILLGASILESLGSGRASRKVDD